MAEGQEPADLRAAYERAVEEAKALRSENQNLGKENRTLKAENLFREAGLRPAQASLFVNANPEGDITLEGVQAFATQFGLAPDHDGKVGETGEPTPASAAQGQLEQESATAPGSAQLGLIGRASARPGTGGQPPAEQGSMTSAEWAELQKRNPSAAGTALKEGRVRLHEGNFYGSQFRELNPI
jgi:hypothetical protein